MGSSGRVNAIVSQLRINNLMSAHYAHVQRCMMFFCWIGIAVNWST